MSFTRPGKPLWVLDNYDSFTYNLVHYLQVCVPWCPVEVIRNDDPRLLDPWPCSRLVISPGPGLPSEAGYLMEVIGRLLTLPSPPATLGVCLGMQALALGAGGFLFNLKRPYHGEASEVDFDDRDPLFEGLDRPLVVGRYHSWAVAEAGEGFIITARSRDGVPMAMRHQTKPLCAVQFHPESILTPQGLQIIRNWLK
ncbi:MAG: aminodeoxychorismate/anthranilate synthase component II [Flavobacteriales bacterium]|nr:aminodeoxychorismate/anthranilate synthase component II [Flavobacteriales bacterium]MCX7768959.1 aminodeoxychorismate/anthranilate synthase component II [Flavobacteriales bacterium]MDW8410804.1 aminodeoxychorismate/anthranilate synthase component II [Flavobacteriales bacterium]